MLGASGPGVECECGVDDRIVDDRPVDQPLRARVVAPRRGTRHGTPVVRRRTAVRDTPPAVLANEMVDVATRGEPVARLIVVVGAVGHDRVRLHPRVVAIDLDELRSEEVRRRGKVLDAGHELDQLVRVGELAVAVLRVE